MGAISAIFPFFGYGFRRSAVFRTSMIGSVISVGFQMAIVISIWTALINNDHQMAYSYEQIIAYSLFTLLIWVCVDTRVARDIERDVREGGVERAFLRPISVTGSYFATALGKVSFNACVLAPAFFIMVFIWKPISLPAHSLTELFCALITLLLSILLVVLIDLCVGLCSFWTVNVFGIDLIKENIIRLLSGSTVPLFLYPDVMQSIIEYLPFALMYFEPADAFVSHADIATYLSLFARQLIWIGIVFMVSVLLTVRIRKIISVAGG